MDDLISRRAALDALNQLSRDNFSLGDWFQTYLTALIAADDAIQRLPSAQRWIPVTERLPEEDGRYLITGKKGTVRTLDFGGNRWYGGISPVAWMPLPKPYTSGADMRGTDNDA